MKKKVIEWFEIENELGKAKVYPGWSFQVWCQINEEKIKKILDIVREKATPSAEYKVFMSQADVVKKKYCKKDEYGKPIIEEFEAGKRYIFEGEDEVTFKTEIEALNLEHEGVVQEYIDKINEYYRFLQEEELEIDVKLLNPKNIPEKYFEDHPDQSLDFVKHCLSLVNIE